MAAASAPLIHVGHGAGPWRIFHLQVRQVEAGQTDEFIYLAVQMAASCHPAPRRSDPVLPAFDAGFGGKPVLDKAEISVWFEYPAHLTQGS